MKKTQLLILCMLLLAFNSNSQEIKRTLVYSKGSMSNDARIITLKSDNTIWWYSKNTKWTELAKKGLPEKNILDIEYIQKIAMTDLETRLIVLLEDKSIWWYAEGKDWQELPLSGLPADKNATDLSACTKSSGGGMMGGGMGIYGAFMNSTRLLLTLDDNTLWFCIPSGKDTKWEQVVID